MRNHTILRLYRAVPCAAVAVLLVIALSCSSAAAAVTFYPRLSVETSYTDNVDLLPDNEEHDFITTISPGFDLGLTGQKNEATLSYTPTWAIYSRFSENNELRHNASLAAMQEITRSTRIELSNDYVFTEDPAYDTTEPISEVDTTVRRDREPYQTNSTDVSLFHQFGPEDIIELGYRYYFLKNDDPRYEDSENQEPRLRITYWPVANRYGIETEASYTERSFDDSEDYDDTYSRLRLIHRVSRHLDVYLEYAQEWTNYVDDGVDYTVYNPLAGFTWAASPNFSLNGSLGYFIQEDDNDEDESGFSGSLETVYSWRERHSFSLLADYGYDQSDTGAETLGFTEYYGVTATLDYQLGRRLNSNFRVAYERNAYQEVEPERDDDIFRANASLTYQALPWMGVEVGYAYRDLSSDVEINEYTENRAFFRVNLSPRRPYYLSR